MRPILSFIAVSFSGLAHSFAAGPDDLLDQFNLHLDPSSVTADSEFDLFSQTGEPDDLFSSTEPVEAGFYDLDTSFSDLAGAPSGSQCLGEATESINIARSLELDQPFDVAGEGEGFCRKASQQTQNPIKLDLPKPEDLYNLLTPDPQRDEIPTRLWPGFFSCIAGDRVQLVCCEGKLNWDSTRDGCEACKCRQTPPFFRSSITFE